MVKQEEKQLLKALKKGDVKSFEFMFRFYYEPLLGYAQKIIKVEAEAEELTQELFLKLWRNRKTLSIKHSLAAYLYRSIYNSCMQWLKREKLSRQYQKDNIKQEVSEINPDEILKYEELNRKFFDLMEALPERRRLIFKMSRFQGLKYKEIAEMLSISLKTVEANMSKTLQYLRENLREYRIQ